MSDDLEKTQNVMQVGDMNPKFVKLEKKPTRGILVAAKSHDAMLHRAYSRQNVKQGKEMSKSRDTIAHDRRWSVVSDDDVDASETLVSHALR